jgi:serine/threonine protein kinase
MTSISIPELVDTLRRYRLLEPAQLDELTLRFQSQFSRPEGFVKELVLRGWLTSYQMDRLLQGSCQELVLGQYLILEQVGEGSMGAVFKAWHRKMRRVVALKVIRKERLASAEVVHRFQREIRAAAQLTHPNIVRAYDADEVDGTHFLVMEFVDGASLARLIKLWGPVPIPLACDFTRQVALGLEHAYERGIVHRDIKPGNLLYVPTAARPASACMAWGDQSTVESSRDPVATHPGGFWPSQPALIKILDMGLAASDVRTAGDPLGDVTAFDGVIGTPNFIAPEQARNARGVDIRADLYSLGCTFYYMLTGRVPFSGGSLAEKVLQHQLDDPPPMEELRPEVPSAVARIVRKLMAKRPEDRYQTPAELAVDLAPWSRMAEPDAAGAAAEPLAVGGVRPDANGQARAEPRGHRRRVLWIPVAALVLLAGVATGFYGRGLFRGTATVGEPARPEPTRPTEPVVVASSPLDQLDPAKIAPDDLIANIPELVALLKGHSGAIWGVAFSPDGRHLATGGTDGVVGFWDLAGPVFRQRATQKKHAAPVSSVTFASEGRLLASSSYDGSVGLWDWSGSELKSQQVLSGVPRGVEPITILGKEKLLVAPSEKGPVQLWYLGGDAPRERPPPLVGHRDDVIVVSWHARSATLATGSRDGTARLWDLSGPEPKERGVTDGELFGISSLGFSPDGKLLAVGCQDGTLKLWDLSGPQPKQRSKLAGHDGQVVSALFLPEGKTLITASNDGRLIEWRVADGSKLRTWQFPASVHRAALAPDGRHLAVANDNGTVAILRLAPVPR